MDIQVGDRVTYKSGLGNRTVIMNNEEQIENYKKSDLIIKIERPTYTVVEEKKELLTEEEKEFLRFFCEYYDVVRITFNTEDLDILRNR